MQITQSKGSHDLLSTKLAPPRLRSSLVSRETLLTRLDEGVERKLTLLSAPAGFGKTTLVSEWIASRKHADDALSAAWVSLDSSDNDPVRFWRYIITACQTFGETIGATSLDLLKSSQQPPFETALTALINDLALLSSRSVLVLEDYHVITSAQIHITVAFLLDHLPSTLHVIMITRSDPPLPLARWRARNDLTEFNAADLRFSPVEIQTFLQQTTQIPLSQETIARLYARTEGWVAGLRLIALALHGHHGQDDIEQFLTGFTGSHRHVMEYLAAEVLASQLESIQEFLLQTSFLGRLTAPLCNAVTGRDDSAAILEHLERANLFLSPLDDAQRWYRYHALFAEAMFHFAQRRFGGDALRDLLDKASQWYEQQGLIADAIETSLSAQEYARAADLIEQLGSFGSFNNELHTLRRWIKPMHLTVLQDHPGVCLSYSIAILFTEDRHSPTTLTMIEPLLQMAERRWQREEDEQHLGQVISFRSLLSFMQGDFVRSFAEAKRSLDLLADDDVEWRSVNVLGLSIEKLLMGEMAAAEQMSLDARRLCGAAGNIHAALAAVAILGGVYTWQGRLREAEHIFQQILTMIKEDLDHLDDKGQALLGLGMVAFERNDLEASERYVSGAVELGNQTREEELRVHSALALVRIKQARGEIQEARRIMESLSSPSIQWWPWLFKEVNACQAWFALVTGDLGTAQRWYTTQYAESGDHVWLIYREREALIAARLLVAQGELDAAMSLLVKWEKDAQRKGRKSSELEIAIQKALTYLAQKNTSQAKQSLIQALKLGLPEGYQRMFIAEGKVMAVLLRDVLVEVKDPSLIDYINMMLLAFDHEPTAYYAAPPVPADMLSPQEQRVLLLLAAGLSNPEIAEQLVVSVNTIKTQVKSIYRKLNVTSRDEASEAARRLRLA